MSKKKKTSAKQQDYEAIRKRDAEKKQQAQQQKRQLRRKRVLTAAAAVGTVGVIAAGCIIGRSVIRSSGKTLSKKITAETSHYQVSAALLACYFRQCEDSYLAYAAGDSSLSMFDESQPLSAQAYSDGMTWYDMFMENTISTLQNNLRICEAAHDAGFTLNEEQLARCREIADTADLAHYQKGVTREALEEAAQITMLAQQYQTEYMNSISVSDADVDAYYEAHSDAYLTASALGYVFSWSPEGILNGDYSDQEAMLAHAAALAACDTQEAYEDYVFRYLTEEQDVARTDAEQIAGELTVTKFLSEYPEEVQVWMRSAKRGETYLLTQEDQCYAQVWFLRDEPAVDDARTVDFRVIYLQQEESESIEETAAFAEQLRDSVESADDPAAVFASYASQYSGDADSRQNGGLVSGYSAKRTAYGSEVSAWAFDSSRAQGDMLIVPRGNAVLLTFFESESAYTGWQIRVRSELHDNAVAAFTQQCLSYEVTLYEKNYAYVTG